MRRQQIETLYRNLDFCLCWIEHLADGQDCRTRRKEADCRLQSRYQGAEIFGKVVEKGRHGKLYTLTIRDYGVFVVTKEVYDKVKVGDEVRI